MSEKKTQSILLAFGLMTCTTQCTLPAPSSVALASQNVYLKGDINCDGRFSTADLDALSEVLFHRTEWQQKHPSCPVEVADVDCSGDISYFDIDSLQVAILDWHAYETAFPECSNKTFPMAE